MSEVALHLGDCLEYMRSRPDKSVDAVITDPPYHLKSIVKRFGKEGSAPAQFGTDGAYSRHSTGFMGKVWDGGEIAHDPKTWELVLRVAKPGAFLLAFGGTRTFHRLACAIEDAGWEIRDTIMWVYGSGFPKSHNLKGDWTGWGTALKPAWEPIIVARRPLEGTVAENVCKYGTGAMNIDGCRVSGEAIPINKLEEWSGFGQKIKPKYEQEMNSKGRWPANLIHDGSEEVLGLFPNNAGALAPVKSGQKGFGGDIYGKYRSAGDDGLTFYGDGLGSAARFFYCAKASKQDRDEGCEGMPLGEPPASARTKPAEGRQNALGNPRSNFHPTVKPTALMRYLCKLVTPPSGVVFDPFMGSGSTGKAAVKEGFGFIGCDNEADYFAIAEKRIKQAQQQMRMDWGSTGKQAGGGVEGLPMFEMEEE